MRALILILVFGIGLAAPAHCFPETGAISSPGEVVSYTLGLAEGRTYLVTVAAKSLQLDPRLEVRDASGKSLGHFDNRLDSTAPFVFLSASPAETVRLWVGCEKDTTGPFTIDAEEVTAARRTVLYVLANARTITEFEGTRDGSESYLVISVYRDGDLSLAQTVRWTLIPDSATGASLADLTIDSDVSTDIGTGSMTLRPSDYLRTVVIAAPADGRQEGRESFVFCITDADQAILPSISGPDLAGSVTFHVADAFDGSAAVPDQEKLPPVGRCECFGRDFALAWSLRDLGGEETRASAHANPNSDHGGAGASPLSACFHPAPGKALPSVSNRPDALP